MAIVQTVDFSDFVRAFEAYNRADQYSRQGLRVIFDYLEELSDDMGEPVEMDVIGICCDYAETPWQDIARDYSIDLTSYEDDDYTGKLEAVLDYLNDNTQVLGETDEGIVYQVF
jgi:hypothetical protein